MVPQIGEEFDQVEARIREIKQTISNLIENLTSTNREYVDARLIELKRIELDPVKGEGRVLFIVLPGMGNEVKEGCSMMNEAMLQLLKNV